MCVVISRWKEGEILLMLSSKDDDDDFNFTKEIILARVRFRTRSTMMHRAPTHFFIRCSLLLYYSSNEDGIHERLVVFSRPLCSQSISISLQLTK